MNCILDEEDSLPSSTSVQRQLGLQEMCSLQVWGWFGYHGHGEPGVELLVKGQVFDLAEATELTPPLLQPLLVLLHDFIFPLNSHHHHYLFSQRQRSANILQVSFETL